MDATIQLDLLHRGEMRMKSILQYCIIVMGKSRIGKSCTYNYILNKPMKGVNLDGDIVYVTTQNDSTAAKMGNSMQSITLEPNISTLYANTSLLDLAGYQNRTGADVMHVSYFISTLFDKVRKVKFILTFEDSMITSNNGLMAENFNYFINLFNYSALSTAIKKELLDSVSIVVTKARGTHQDYKKKMLKKAEAMKASQKLLIQNKEVIINMIESIAASNRIFTFKQAEEGVMASKQDLIGRLNQGGWKFLDIPKNKDQLKKQNKELVILPFRRDFQGLYKEEQKNIEDFLRQRIKKLSEGFSNLIRVYLQKSIQNWKSAIQYQSFFEYFKTIVMNNLMFMMEVENFLGNTYKNYKSQTLMTEIKFNKLSEVPLLALIDSTLQMKDILKGSTNDKEKIETNLKYLLNQIINLINLLGNFCFDDQEYNQLMRVAFVMTRAVEQFLTFYKIKPDLVNDIHFKLRDNLEEVLGNSINYSKYVMNSIKKEMMEKLFPTIDNLNYFQRLADEYFNYFTTNERYCVQYKKDENGYQSKYLMIKANAEIIKFNISLKQLNSIQSIDHLKNLFQSLSMALNKITNSKERKFLLDKQMTYVIEASKLVMKLDPKQYPNKSFRAIKLAQLSKSFSLIQMLYKEALEEEKQTSKEKSSKLSNEYTNLANHCTQFLLSWGQVEKARIFLYDHFKIYFESENYQDKDEVMQNLQEINISKKEYEKNISKKNEILKSYLTQDELKQLKDLLNLKLAIKIPISKIQKVKNSQPVELQRVKTEANPQIKPEPEQKNVEKKKETVNPQYKPEPDYEKKDRYIRGRYDISWPVDSSKKSPRNEDVIKNQQTLYSNQMNIRPSIERQTDKK